MQPEMTFACTVYRQRGVLTSLWAAHMYRKLSGVIAINKTPNNFKAYFDSYAISCCQFIYQSRVFLYEDQQTSDDN